MPTSCDEWKGLAIDVHDWLVATTFQKKHTEWRWGVNLFWIAYVGFSTQFPQCSFSAKLAWDPNMVPVAGEYIRSRIQAQINGVSLKEETNEERWALWQGWFKLRETWRKDGVEDVEFHLRVAHYGS